MMKSIYIQNDIDIDEDEKFIIHEVSVCNCFLDWGVYFKQVNSGRHSLNFIKDYFDNVLLAQVNNISSDVFIMFGSVSIVCCKRGLYHLLYKDDVDKKTMDDNCPAELVDFCCVYYLDRSLFFYYICENCKLTFLKIISKRFTAIKI